MTECIKAGFRPHIIYETSQWDFISEMVSANLGIGLLPERICRGLDPEKVKVIPLVDPVIPWHLAIIWRKDRYLPFAARAWLEHTKSYLWDPKKIVKDDANMDAQSATKCLTAVRQHSPLVHSITNNVVTNFTANGLLALGASPVMAYAKEEVADMAKIAGALVLNIGTLSKESVEAMIIAGKSANEHGVPVILDPVGAGATPFRTESARGIIREVHLSAIRGNAAEIAHTVGVTDWLIKGVDAGEGGGDIIRLAQQAAQNSTRSLRLLAKSMS